MGLLDIFFRKWTENEILAYLKAQIDLINIDGHADEKEHQVIFSNMKIIKWQPGSQKDVNNKLSEAKKMPKNDCFETIKKMSSDKKKIISLGLKTMSLADNKLLDSEEKFLIDIAEKTGIPSVVFTKLELAKFKFANNSEVTESIPESVKKVSSDFHDNYTVVDELILGLDNIDKDYKFCKLIFQKIQTGSIRSDDELNAFILKFLRKQSRDEMISKTVNFQTIENILGSALIEYEENNDTSFNGYVELEQYHSATTRSFQLSQQVMFESILSGAK